MHSRNESRKARALWACRSARGPWADRGGRGREGSRREMQKLRPTRSLRRGIRVAACDGSCVLLFCSTFTAFHTSSIAVGMFAAPFPRAAYDGFELRKLRSPMQVTLDAFRARH